MEEEANLEKSVNFLTKKEMKPKNEQRNAEHIIHV